MRPSSRAWKIVGDNVANPNLTLSWGTLPVLVGSLGCTYIPGGMSCDHNGGARWGNRINGWYEGDGNITGHGWANYSCSRSDMPSVDTGIPSVYVPTIRELMWVR